MRHRQTNNRQSGFTLVEIAIVLVIIGLLLGGILKGQEMIVQAKIKNTISDYNGVLAAYNGYIDRYRALPGDDPGADARWTLTNANGNGNGVINGTYNAGTATPEPESRLFWQHLRQAGFIPGTGAQQPTNAHNGIVGVQTGDGPATGGTVTAIWGTTGPPAINGLGSVLICSSQVPDKVAIAVDNQTDDGIPNNGQVRAGQGSGNAALSGTGAVTAPAANYQEAGGTNLYVVCRAI